MRTRNIVLAWGIVAAATATGLVACGTSDATTGDEAASGAQSSAPPAPAGSGAATTPASSDAPPRPPPPPPPGDPDAFATGEVDVVSVVRTAEERKPISPLIYGLNTIHTITQPARLMQGVTFVRRGGDRSNTYNWETNVSNGSFQTAFGSDLWLVATRANPNAPAELDRALIAENRAAGRGSMVPFVLNGYVAGPVATNIPYTTPGWPIDQYFRRVELVKPAPFAPAPDPNDGVVYTDEHLHFLRAQFPGDIYAPGPTQVIVGTDNEPDLYAFNFPMLQRGGGGPLYASGAYVGNRVTGAEFTARFLTFARRVRELAPTAMIVGPDHYHYDGWTTWHDSTTAYGDAGRWFMDDFLESVRAASEASGTRLLDAWDFHWYPQRVFDGTFTWALDHAARPMTDAEIEAVLQGPRSYWDETFDEHSWITDDHLHAPAMILKRLKERLAQGYPGTKLGVTEYFPGGCAHVSSGLATADTLGVFGRMGIHVAAMWPHTCDLAYAFGGFELLRNADGNGLRFAETSVRVEHPERAESSLYAATDEDDGRVTVVVINKTNAHRRFGVRLFHARLLADVDVYRIDAVHPEPALAAHEVLAKKNAFAYDAPPLSAALLVFRAK